MNIEGIPDGWEPVRFDYANDGDAFLGGHGEILVHLSPRPTQVKRLIVRKIEKPKRYRPFANAAEFEPFRDRWVKYNGDNDCEENNVARVVEYSDVSASINQDTDTWKDHFDNYAFDDGTPFGIEVKE